MPREQKVKTVVKEMRESIAKGREKFGEETEYFCGVCEKKISRGKVSMGCIQCFNWIHIPCTDFSNTIEAEKHERVFKCKKCMKGGESPKNIKENKDNPNEINLKTYRGM